MQVKHTLTVVALCPVDKAVDVYQVEVMCDRVINVETILRAAKKYEATAIFQENLTCELARDLGATVKTVGYHSGVKTEVTA